MWFRNLCIYRLITPFGLSPEELHGRLLSHAFQPCGPLEPTRDGWVPPLGQQGSLLTHAANGCILLCARREQKVLPAAVVREALEARVLGLQEAEGRKIRRKERLAIRDEIVHELLPKAFTRSSLTCAYLAVGDGYLVVDAASHNRAEELVTLLRDSLDSFPVEPLAVQQAPPAAMSRWLEGAGMPPELSLGDECELREPADQGGVVRCKRQDLTEDEVQAHLRAGKIALKLGLAWGERLSFVLGEDLSVRRLRFSDVVQEEAYRDLDEEDELARFDADFSLMTLELSRFIDGLMKAFGGEDREAYGPSGKAA